MRISRTRYLFFLSVLILVNACKQKSDSLEKAGLAISFDDHFIDEWYELRPLFRKYDAKVTFFITCGDTLTKGEIFKLSQLQSDGHEIGFHGTVHSVSTLMIGELGPQKYKETELLPGMAFMKEAGFNPTSYAHPGGNHNQQVDSVLFASGFKVLRDVAIANRKYMEIPLYSFAPRVMNWIYYPFNKERSVNALLIDTDTALNEEQMQEAVKRASDTGTALMLFGHKPLHGSPKTGEYGFDVGFLEKILQAAKTQHLKYYTMSELPEL